MNDYREFEHGKDNLIHLIDNSNEGKALKETFDSLAHQVFENAYEKFKYWAFFIKDDFYNSCLSEHIQTEDRLGKLSMWRAYGGHAGVAIIFKRDLKKIHIKGWTRSPPII